MLQSIIHWKTHSNHLNIVWQHIFLHIVVKRMYAIGSEDSRNIPNVSVNRRWDVKSASFLHNENHTNQQRKLKSDGRYQMSPVNMISSTPSSYVRACGCIDTVDWDHFVKSCNPGFRGQQIFATYMMQRTNKFEFDSIPLQSIYIESNHKNKCIFATKRIGCWLQTTAQLNEIYCGKSTWVSSVCLEIICIWLWCDL